MTVIEHTPFSLLCKAYSVPKPDYYSWSLPAATSNSSIFESPGLSRHDKKGVTCSASNTMISSDGTSKKGDNNISISIDIQCKIIF